jgi:hypothetical protein
MDNRLSEFFSKPEALFLNPSNLRNLRLQKNLPLLRPFEKVHALCAQPLQFALGLLFEFRH